MPGFLVADRKMLAMVAVLNRLIGMAALLAATPGFAAVYSTPTTTAGNQAWGGTLGLDFTVNSSVQVNSLGAFNSTKTGITTNINVAIFNRIGTIVSPTVNFSGTTGTDSYLYKTVSPFILTPGSYQIGAWGYNGADMNYNSQGGASSISFDSFGGKLSATGTRYAFAAGGIGDLMDAGATRYGAASMIVSNPAPNTPFVQPLQPPVDSQGIYHALNNIAANQTWGGTLGLDFSANRRFQVTSLGAFDAGRNGITANIKTAIFNMAGQLVTPTIDFNGANNAAGLAYVFKDLATPLWLEAGDYQLVSWGYDGTNGNYNSSGGSSEIAFRSLNTFTPTGSRYSNPVDAGLLAQLGDNGALRYGAGSFLAVVPEPQTWGLMIVGFGLIGVTLRRRTCAIA